MNTKHFSAMKISAAVAVAAFGLLDASSAMAATDTDNLIVSAKVDNICTIATTPLAFGSYDGVVTNLTTDLDVDGQVTVTCTLAGADVTVTLGQGAHSGSGSTDLAPVRRMVDGASHFMTYSIFSNALRTLVWNNTTGVATTPTGSAVNVPIYGRIDKAQSLPGGIYGDSVVATVTF